MSEKLNEVPAGWAATSIGELLEPLSDGRTLHHGWSPQCEVFPSTDDADWGVLKTTAIQDGRFLPEHNKKLPSSLEPRPKLEVREGDLLITCAGPRARCGIPCLVRHTRPRLLMSGKMYRFRPRTELLSAHFLEAFLLSPGAQALIDGMKTGSSDSGLNLTHDRFLKLPVPLPPLPEQWRIVEKIEELFSDLDAGVAALERVRANLRRYRASVLNAAVTGKLTAGWREAHPPAEPADRLLERILTDRRRKWEEDQLRKFTTAGKPPPKGWRERYEAPEPLGGHRLSNLPSSWPWITIDGIAYVTKLAGFEYTKYVKYDDRGDLAVLKAENAGKEGFHPTDFSRVRSDTVRHLERSKLYGGEILMVFVGAGVGQVARVPNDRAYFLGPNICMIRVESPHLLPLYVELFLRSPLGQGLALSFTKAVAQPSLSMGTIRMIPIAVPPPCEQLEIVAEVERRLSVVDAVEAEVEQGLRRAARLRQAILKRAFQGRLVPQDPTDEPAAALLERLRADGTQVDVGGKSPARGSRRRKSPGGVS